MPKFSFVNSTLLVEGETPFHIQAGLVVAVKVIAIALSGTDYVVAGTEVISWKLKWASLRPHIRVLVVSVRNTCGSVGC